MQLKVDPRSYTLPAPGSYDPLANIQATYAPRTEPPDAVPGIQRRRLGASELLVSECTLGGMTWGEQNSDAEASEQLSLAFDFGVNFIDTAEAYPVPIKAESSGATDRAIAAWMALTKRPRDQVVLSTKVCGFSERYTWFPGREQGTSLTDAQIKRSVDESLSRLRTDYIDVLQFHWPERPVGLTGLPSERRIAHTPVPIEEQVRTIGDLLQQGKIRAWGLSNENSEGVLEFRRAARELGVDQPCCVQNAYSLLQRVDEAELIPALAGLDGEAPISYLPYSPLSGGVLSGKYGSRRKAPRRSRLSLRKGYTESFKSSNGPKAVDLYVELARAFGITPTQLALAHCRSRPFVASTIVGATSTSQLAENLQGFSVEWTQEMETLVRAAYAQYPEPWRVQIAGMG